jgi:tripartite-type tricarboxylate transporter receptor subunit TctC
MRKWLQLVASSLALALASAGVHAAYPERPITIVVANPPGGQTDVATRIIAHEMSAILKQPVVIENKPGANSNLGAMYVKNKPADGYTLIVTAINNFGSNPALLKDMPFDPPKDFRMIVQTIASTNVIVVAPDSPYHTLDQILKDARASPGKLTYGSAGEGSSMFLFMEMLKNMAKVDILHVPYQGSAKADLDVMAHQITMVFDSMPGAWPLVEGKRMRAIAVSSEKRSPVAPDVPTVAETVPGFAAESWLGLAAVAGTPDDIIQTINKAANEALANPKVRDQILKMGARPVGGTSAESQAFVECPVPTSQKVMAAEGVKDK